MAKPENQNDQPENFKKLAQEDIKEMSLKKLQAKVIELQDLVETISRGKMVWQSTFDVISDPVMIIDRNYQITRANLAMASAVKKDVRDVIGEKCYKVFAGCEEPCEFCPMEQTRSDHKHHSVELTPFPRGDQYYVNAYFMPEENSEQENVILYYRNITDEKDLQKKLMQTDKMAAIGTLAGGIAHEINNPLGAILAFTQLVIRELDEQHSCQKDLHEIEEATLRCKKIVRDLLDFSRQNYDQQMQEVKLNSLIDKTIPLIHVSTRTHAQIDITIEKNEKLPKVWGHYHKLQQVLVNLITNALYAMKNSGGSLLIKTDYDHEKKEAVLTVQDSGEGIPTDLLPKIFNPYFTTKEQGEGTGLGLSICYRIIQEHNGRIDVKSDVSEGTEFTIKLPALI